MDDPKPARPACIAHHGPHALDGCATVVFDDKILGSIQRKCESFDNLILLMTEVLQVSYALIFCVYSAIPYALTLVLAKPPTPDTTAPVHKILKSLNLCLASTVISITSVLNFSLAASLAILLGVPTILSGPSRLPAIKYGYYALLGLGWLFLRKETEQACYNWEVLGAWFAPFVCIVYTPLVLQAGIAGILPS